MSFRPTKPCRFGYDCNKFREGRCTYLHDNSQPPQQNPHNSYVPPHYDNHGQMNGPGRGKNSKYRPDETRYPPNPDNYPLIHPHK